MDDDGRDIISNLPRDILCHILSFLPTKYAIATCILSTKWRNLYSSIPNLVVRLDDTLLLHPQSISNSHTSNFTRFVNRLLYLTLRDVPSILGFGINCQYFNDGHQIGDWIGAALRLSVKWLILQIHRLRESSFLFDSLFGCNIVCLHLCLRFDDVAPECRFSLPNLIVLSITSTKAYVVNDLIASCPLLETLVVKNCIFSIGEKLEIYSPSLYALELHIGNCSRSAEIELDTPKLEHLLCCGFLALNYSLHRLDSLREAYLNLHQNALIYAHHNGGQAIKLLKACSNAPTLRLSEAFFSILRISRLPLPSLEKLAVLKIIEIDSHGWELLLSLLQCAPKLRVLVLEVFDFECYETFKTAVKETFTIQICARNKIGFFFKIQKKIVNLLEN